MLSQYVTKILEPANYKTPEKFLRNVIMSVLTMAGQPVSPIQDLIDFMSDSSSSSTKSKY